MDNLTTLIRKLTGRQLTERQIEKSKRHVSTESDDVDKEYSIINDEFVVTTRHKRYAILHDTSDDDQVRGFFPYHAISRIYNKDGLLVEKQIYSGNGEVFENTTDVSMKQWKYEPPGSYRGKRVEEHY